MILTSKTNFIKDLLSEKLQLIDYKMYLVVYTARSTSASRRIGTTSF